MPFPRHNGLKMINTEATLTTERPAVPAADHLSEQTFDDRFTPHQTDRDTPSFGALLALVTGNGTPQSKGQANHHLRLHLDARALHHQEQVRYQLLSRTA